MAGSLGRVLIVDDQPHVAQLLRDALQDFGYTVKIALTPGEALGLIGAFQPDVLLLDLWGPRVSGPAALEAFGRRDPDLPVIVITANRDLEAARAVLATVFEYVPTPIDLDVVQRAVAAAVVAREHRASLRR